VNNLPKVVTQLCPEYDLNPRPVDCKSNALPVAPPHLVDALQFSLPMMSLMNECDTVVRVAWVYL